MEKLRRLYPFMKYAYFVFIVICRRWTASVLRSITVKIPSLNRAFSVRR
jgi:hypothetical protein